MGTRGADRLWRYRRERRCRGGYQFVDSHSHAYKTTRLIDNRATLLLTHSPSQILNQQRLESYLSASNQHKFDISDRFESSLEDSIESQPRLHNDNGTNTPRDLHSRIKILEIYTLHVLPRNEEWEYAKDFISMSEVLDEERRETFLHALESLQTEKIRDDGSEITVVKERDEDLEREQQQIEQEKREVDRPSVQSPDSRSGHKAQNPPNGEIDYGIEQPPPPIKSKAKPPPKSTLKTPSRNHTRLSPDPRPSSKPKKPATTSVYKRSLALLTALQHAILNIGQSLSGNPMQLLRMVLFIMGLIVAFSRRDVRERLARITGRGWQKVRGTVGMGVKVSYI